MAEIRYVAAFPTAANWLLVQTDKGARISLPYGLKVSFLGRTGNRDTFQILEGVNKGARASVAQKGPNDSYLTPAIQQLPPAEVRFDSKSQRLTFGGRGPVNAFSGMGSGVEAGRETRYTPVPPGMYELAIPAYPSAQTRVQYGQWTRFHQTWFRIGLNTSGSRFLHAGEISDGCVTIRQFLYDGQPGTPLPSGFDDLAGAAHSSNRGLIGLPLPAKPVSTISFDDIYNYLILRRLNDQAVGRLYVTNNGAL